MDKKSEYWKEFRRERKAVKLKKAIENFKGC